MKKMRILVVDNTIGNIEAAKIASMSFPQHEFVFMTSAHEAFSQIENFDAIISDLFFPEKPDGGIEEAYEKMLAEYSCNNYCYKEMIRGGEHLYPIKKFEKNLSVVKNGLTINLVNYKELNIPEFPLGLTIVVEAKKLEKKLCLVSDIHGHGDADGDIILLPLLSNRTLSISQVHQDGSGSLFYIGSNRIEEYTKEYSFGRKKNPIVWEKAIHCTLAQ